MKIGLFGLGYLSAVSAGFLTKDGYEVIGVDQNQTKVDLINRGKTPIIEKDIEKIIKQAVGKKILQRETKRLVCLGSVFKSGTDDLREIPLMRL